MKKIMYICSKFDGKANGASQVTKRNLNVLKHILGESDVIQYYYERPSNVRLIQGMICGASYGYDLSQDKRAIEIACNEDVDCVFIEGSLYGGLVKGLHKKHVRTIVFCHNIEVILYNERFKSSHSIGDYIKYLLVRRAESMSMKHSDDLIVLNNRDNIELSKKYNKNAILEVPITYNKRDLKITGTDEDTEQNNYALFVGSDFFPNVEGIRWFIEKVAPYINIEVHVVGGCGYNDDIKNMKIPSNVKILGYVDDLDKEYQLATMVIAPIFKGSGMKTKSIEALSYGKTIIGTQESLEGILGDKEKIGALCNTAEDFIKSINSYKGGRINQYSVDLFNKYYTDEVCVNKYKVLLEL